jgi:hypothetical protein
LNFVFNQKFWKEFELRLGGQIDRKLGGIEAIRAVLNAVDAMDAQGEPAQKELALRQAWSGYVKSRVKSELELWNREEVDDKALDRAAMLCKTWADYLVLREQCQEIFLEFHDVIAGLVYREKRFEGGKGFDPAIFHAADALISDCATKTLANSLDPSFSMPSPREAIAWTIGRIVRLRYSEWTVFSLPLVAHEFGQLLLNDGDYKGLIKIFDGELKSTLMELNPEGRDALRSDLDAGTKRKFEGLAQKRVDNELRYYLADAFAAWVVGPAYAYAAIFERFSPTYPSTIEATDSFDHERAIMVLEVLRKMGEPGFASDDFNHESFKVRLDDLEEAWRKVVKRANFPTTSDTVSGEKRIDERRATLRKVSEKICQEYNDLFYLKLLLYTQSGSEGGEGWYKAQEWSVKWINALGNEGARALPDIEADARSTVRDALNAGWLCRASRPADVARIELALRKLLSDIVGQRRNSGI